MWPFATGLGKLTPPVALLPAGEAQPVEVGCELDGPGDDGVDDDGDQFIDELPCGGGTAEPCERGTETAVEPRLFWAAVHGADLALDGPVLVYVVGDRRENADQRGVAVDLGMGLSLFAEPKSVA